MRVTRIGTRWGLTHVASPARALSGLGVDPAGAPEARRHRLLLQGIPRGHRS